MNDLESLWRFRAEVGDPDPERVRAARRAVLAGSAGRPAASRSRWARRVTVTAAAAAAFAAAIVAVGVVPMPGGDGARVRDTAAADVLNRVARAAAGRPPSPVPTAGQYWYVSWKQYEVADDGSTSVDAVEPVQTGSPSGSPAPQPLTEEQRRQLQELNARPAGTSTREEWIARDGSGRLVTTGTRPDMDEPFRRGEWFLEFAPSYEDVLALPRDPDTLYALADRDRRENADGHDDAWVAAGVFETLSTILRAPYTPNDLSVALYEALARVPGVTLVGQVTDLAGRTGTAVSVPYAEDTTYQMIFDEATGRVLGERGVARDGTVLGASTITASGIVNGTDERP